MRKLAVLFTALTLSACLHVRSMPLGPPLPPKPENATIEVYAVPPPGPFRQVALLELDAGGGLSTIQAAEHFKKAAREVGADAIILGNQTVTGMSYNTMVTGPNMTSTASATVRYTATAIAFEDRK